MKFQFGLLTLLIACTGGENVIEKQNNTAPVVMIASHSPNAEILEGYVEPFRATVSDDDNEFVELTVAWYVGEEIVCDWASVSPAGESFCDIAFETGDTNVIAEVRDPQGAGGRAEIAVDIVPTSAPTAEILSPTQSSNHYSDQLIQFSAVVGDNEDAPEDLLIAWSSSVDGDLILDTSPDADGNISDYGYLSEGQHALELRVEDSSGKVTKEQLTLQVGGANAVPTCELLSPTTQSSFQVGEAILFEGTALDDNVPASELMVTFSSDKDGLLGNATVDSSGSVIFTTDQLSNNTHVISLLVEDEVGASCQSSIVLSIGTPPSATIVEPQSGDVFSVGADVLFNGTIGDAEDSMNNIAISWNSSSAGEMASGNPDSQGVHQFSTNTLSAGLHTIALSATDTTGLSGSDTITIRINTPPTAPTVTLNPDPVYGDGTLTAAAVGSTDLDGDPVTYAYQWFENGVLHPATVNSIASVDLDVGDVWTVRVIPNDGYTNGAYTEANITVANSLPTLTSPVISSSSGSTYTDSVLTCTSSASDADEVVNPTYSWDVNGATITGATIDLTNYATSVGDTISCTATVTDSYGGSATDSNSVLVENRAPTLSGVSISPSSPNSNSVLTCTSVSMDPDGDVLTESVEWFMGGSSLGTGTTLDLASVSASPNDTVECSVVVTDPSGATDQQSATTTVINTNPTIDVLTLTPSDPTLSDTLSCYAETSDIDGDTPSLVFSFTNQSTGSVFSPTTTSTNLATLDVSSTDADFEHVITCSVTVTDADGGTTSDSVNTTIVNTAPIFDQDALISPSNVEIGTTVDCSAVASDPDGGAPSMSYLWQVNGGQVATGATWTVNSADASVGDSLTCTAIAVDAESNSTTSISAPVVISNTAPEVGSVVLNNLGPYTNDVLTVSHTTFDFNGDSVTLNYEWHVVDANNGLDSIVQTGSGNTLDGSLSTGFDRDDEVYVMVTPNDGTENGVSVESDHAMVLNSPPVAPGIAVLGSGSPPIAQVDSLTCAVTTPSTDLDGDSFLYTYNWYDPSGNLFQSLYNVTDLSDEVADTDTSEGQWECEVVVSDGTDSTASNATINVESDFDGPLTFTNCGKTGSSGPSQSDCDSEYVGTTLDNIVTVTSGLQTWMVPSTGTYSIEVMGAKGGDSVYSNNLCNGGHGALMQGDFALNEGEVLTILVGQMGGSGTIGCGTGGGGTFVVAAGNTPLIIAGGGGGAGWDRCNAGNIDGQISTTGGNSYDNSGNLISGGTSGNGGGAMSANQGSSGGGGFYSNGSNSYGSYNGFSYLNGGQGGSVNSSQASGFGGGGGIHGNHTGGGGGGGYSGGAGGANYNSPSYGGGGGGSYNSGVNQVNLSGVGNGHGYVIIDKL